MVDTPTPIINKVRNRFLPLTESVAKGLEREPRITDFEKIKLIGKGSFGIVNLARHKETKAIYAIKEISKLNKNNQEGKPYFRREIEIMYKVHHPNVVRLFSHFEDDQNCYFVMEFVKKGDLFKQSAWEREHCFPASEVAKFMKDLISAVYYLHNMCPPIIHRDIKPENVLITESGVAKLTDFGWSNYINSEIRSTYCGTPVYLAPEMIKEIGHDEHLDIWCIGVLIFELLTGNVPFMGKDFRNLNDNILNLNIQWPKDINVDAKNLISRILKPNPMDRISLEEMVKHPFFKKHLPDMEKCLKKPQNTMHKPFIISKDIPSDFESDSVPANEEGNSSFDNEQETIASMSDTFALENGQIQKKMNDDIDYKEVYFSLQKEYEKLMAYNTKLVIEKGEKNKQLQEANQHVLFLKKEKADLLKQIDEDGKNKISLINEIVELNDTIAKKDELIASLQKANESLLNNKDTCSQDVIAKMNLDYEERIKEKDEEINDLKMRISKLEKDIIKNDSMENQISSFRQSIKSINDSLSFPIENSTRSELDEYKAIMENKLKNTKEYFEIEIDKMKEEFKREKEKFTVILKLKEEGIQKLIKNQDTIREQEQKKYETIIVKYEQSLKVKESEIVKLKLIKKKLEMMYNTYVKKKDTSSSQQQHQGK